MTGYAGLMDPSPLDNVVDLPLAVAQCFNDAAAGRIGQSLERIDYMHVSVYVYIRI